MSSSKETVLVVGSTGNIGVAVARAILNTGRQVLAVVRNQASADKLVKFIGSREGIVFTEADVLSETGLKEVVDRVRAGELPGFQHVFACVGGDYATIGVEEITADRIHSSFKISFESNFFAYKHTIPYLKERGDNTSWTICTGSQGDIGIHILPAMIQGALYSFCTGATRDTADTNVRFNEIYVGFRIEVDEMADTHPGAARSSDFVPLYQKLLDRPDIRGSRVWGMSMDDVKELRWDERVPSTAMTWDWGRQ